MRFFKSRFFRHKLGNGVTKYSVSVREECGAPEYSVSVREECGAPEYSVSVREECGASSVTVVTSSPLLPKTTN